ncbi:MAG: hypothetical protein JSS02_19470 [Planctomycetes bacterium]|nr:hypothetical protein [Planctomycetota bacterium]
MQLSNKEIRERLDAARNKIISLFCDQCTHGAQTAALHDPLVAACGQFLGDSARTVPQRGLHGTAAALAVITQSPAPDKEKNETLTRLVRYALDRAEAESKSDNPTSLSSIEVDAQNTIKTAELLLAVSCLPTSVPNSDRIHRVLVQSLKKGQLEERAWGYFLDQPESGPDLLPTAYATMALAAADEDVAKPTQFLLDELSEDAGSASTAPHWDGDVTIRIVCLYALVFRKRADQYDLNSEQKLVTIFDVIWNRMERLIRGEHLEQNVEYWRSQHTFYVRVPWQLYLLALAARLSFYKRFSTFGAQLRLKSIIDDVLAGKFRYPHSGVMISSRTNAIAFEVLGHVQAEMRRKRVVSPLIWLDQVRTSSTLRWTVSICGVGLVVWSIIHWSNAPNGVDLAEVAPNFIASIVAWLALWARRR